MTSPYYGVEAEYLLQIAGKTVRAKQFATKPDQNDSIGEIRTSPQKSVEEVQRDLKLQIKQECDNIAHKLKGASGIILPLTHVVFTPYDVVWSRAVFAWGEDELPMEKTCGVHYHASYNDSITSPVNRSRISRDFDKRIRPLLSGKPKQRESSEVIGPYSGEIYKYGRKEDYWREKGERGGHWEFRPIPSSLIIQDLELFYKFLSGNATDNDIIRIVEMCETDYAIGLMDVIETEMDDAIIVYDDCSLRPNFSSLRVPYPKGSSYRLFISVDESHCTPMIRNYGRDKEVIIVVPREELELVLQRPQDYIFKHFQQEFNHVVPTRVGTENVVKKLNGPLYESLKLKMDNMRPPERNMFFDAVAEVEEVPDGFGRIRIDREINRVDIPMPPRFNINDVRQANKPAQPKVRKNK